MRHLHVFRQKARHQWAPIRTSNAATTASRSPRQAQALRCTSRTVNCLGTGRVYLALGASAPAAAARGLIPQGIQSLYPADGASVWARAQTGEGASMVWMPSAALETGSSGEGSTNPGQDISALIAAIAA